jgi:hypothetical protein
LAETTKTLNETNGKLDTLQNRVNSLEEAISARPLISGSGTPASNWGENENRLT